MMVEAEGMPGVDISRENILDKIRWLYKTLRNNTYGRSFINGLRIMLQDKMAIVYFSFLVFILVLALIGPVVAPYDHTETHYTDEGEVKQLESPSTEHLLGTTWRGEDVFSKVLFGARPTAMVGVIGGLMIVGIGLTVGVTAGYVGGRTENILMRITDFVYGVPVIPTSIVIIAIFGIGFMSSILVIGLLLWRSSARVIRSQVLQIKEYPFIQAAKATGASTPRIIFENILPNVAAMAVFFFAWGIGYSILIQASLAFLGVSDPFVPGWGIMLRNVFNSGYIATAWWWSMPPGLLISFTVISTFMFGRRFEALSESDEQKHTMAG